MKLTWVMSWSCLRSSPFLKIIVYASSSWIVVLNWSNMGARLLLNKYAVSWIIPDYKCKYNITIKNIKIIIINGKYLPVTSMWGSSGNLRGGKLESLCKNSFGLNIFLNFLIWIWVSKSKDKSLKWIICFFIYIK